MMFADVVKERIGAGSFGAVYLVEDVKTMEEKALKIFFKGGERVW
jgi:serine/threonine protein kinase